jgi:RsiW-degrading membrane proteinase PrsW (M82 family)
MKDNIRRDRQLLKAFLLLLLLSTSVFLFMGSDEMSAKYVGKFFFRVFFGIIILFLLLSATYIYKVCKWCYSNAAVPWIIAILFLACFFSKFATVSFIIGIFIIWKSKRLLSDEQI